MGDAPTTNELTSLAAGWNALRAADWAGARAAFTAALDAAPAGAAGNAAALDGLGIALWWLNEIDEAHRRRAAAYLAYRQRGEWGRAAVIAAWLAREQVFLNANPNAMNGWFARAERLLAEAGDGPEAAWVALYRASMLAPPPELEQATERALAVARQSGDADLEGLALAFGGLARVSLGRVAEGLALLDEAMTMALGGEIGNFMVISEAFCVLLSACALAGDLTRTDQWRRAADDFARRYHCSFLSAYCRAAYGSLLTATGQWDAAETALMEAITAFERGHRGLRIHATLSLAELRVAQGRLEEAETLLTGNEDVGAATVTRARLHLARGESDLALAVLGEALGQRAPALADAPLLALLVDARLAADEVAAAGRAAEALAGLAELAHSDWLLAAAELARGHVARHAGDPAAATEHYRAALYCLAAHERSLTAGHARLAMAQALRDSDWAGAVTWARAALATFDRLGARRDADEAAALLRDLGTGSRPGPRAGALLTRRETEVLALLAAGLANREIADRLVISPKTVEHHVSRVLDKLGLRNRAEAAAYAARIEQ